MCRSFSERRLKCIAQIELGRLDVSQRKLSWGAVDGDMAGGGLGVVHGDLAGWCGVGGNGWRQHGWKLTGPRIVRL